MSNSTDLSQGGNSPQVPSALLVRRPQFRFESGRPRSARAKAQSLCQPAIPRQRRLPSLGGSDAPPPSPALTQFSGRPSAFSNWRAQCLRNNVGEQGCVRGRAYSIWSAEALPSTRGARRSFPENLDRRPHVPYSSLFALALKPVWSSRTTQGHVSSVSPAAPSFLAAQSQRA